MNLIHLPNFTRYVGINYSGAEAPEASLKGLRDYLAERTSTPVEVPPHRVRANTGPAGALHLGL